MVMIWFAETTENAESLEFATVEDVEKYLQESGLSNQILDESESKFYIHCIYQLNSFLYPKLTSISVHISFSVNDNQDDNEIKNMAQSSTGQNTGILLFIRLFLNKTLLLFGR